MWEYIYYVLQAGEQGISAGHLRKHRHNKLSLHQDIYPQTSPAAGLPIDA